MTTKRDQVIQLIDAFDELCPEAHCSFAHIVIGDLNLADGDIKYCLKKETVEEWFAFALSQLDPTAANPESDKSWERFQYDDLVETRDIIKAFLRFLLAIPGYMRDR